MDISIFPRLRCFLLSKRHLGGLAFVVDVRDRISGIDQVDTIKLAFYQIGINVSKRYD